MCMIKEIQLKTSQFAMINIETIQRSHIKLTTMKFPHRSKSSTKVIWTTITLLLIVVTLAECMKRTQYHEQVRRS